jgi:O-methyltransferase
MYQSTDECLRFLYPNLSEGGFCLVDDYWALNGCRLAVDDYRERNGITTPLNRIDWSGVYWRKSK